MTMRLCRGWRWQMRVISRQRRGWFRLFSVQKLLKARFSQLMGLQKLRWLDYGSCTKSWTVWILNEIVEAGLCNPVESKQGPSAILVDIAILFDEIQLIARGLPFFKNHRTKKNIVFIFDPLFCLKIQRRCFSDIQMTGHVIVRVK